LKRLKKCKGFKKMQNSKFNLNSEKLQTSKIPSLVAAGAGPVFEILEQIPDPEIPVLSILDLGIVRDVVINESQIEIIITPTYSGCPAMDAISMDIKMKMLEHGYKDFKVTLTLSPAWSTDWMTEAGKQKLQQYGIAPPSKNDVINCPQCNSNNVVLLSQFGSTACKALYQCQSCKEPFDYFKCH
jgi:ring-1,2-phenylacetyl-CoA epoxidase subunit PaaD